MTSPEEEEEQQEEAEKKMLDEVLNTDYHITKEELLDYMTEEKEREYDSTLPHEVRQQNQIEEELLSKEIVEEVNKRPDGRYGFRASEILEQQTAMEEAERRHTQHNIQRYKEHLRKLMIMFEEDRLRVLSWANDMQAGKEPYFQFTDDEELEDCIKFMYELKQDIERLQGELKEWEEEEKKKK